MTNHRKLIEGLGGMPDSVRIGACVDEEDRWLVTDNENESALDKHPITFDILKLIACPFEASGDPEALEIEGCPSAIQCAKCKREWLAREAGS